MMLKFFAAIKNPWAVGFVIVMGIWGYVAARLAVRILDRLIESQSAS